VVDSTNAQIQPRIEISSARTRNLRQAIEEKAFSLGFELFGVTSPDPPAHFDVFLDWLKEGRQGEMGVWLAREDALQRRANPAAILPECRSILVLGMRYSSRPKDSLAGAEKSRLHGRVAAYAWGEDYHEVIPPRLQALVRFIEELLQAPVPHRCYTDTGPILERELAQRAGLGWIGKNTCLINPQHGSFFFLAEIFLGISLEPDPPFLADRCGACTRCIDACPTGCILPDRTIDARRCISYLTIELKGAIPPGLRPYLGEWVFGCDICQEVCPWNVRFSRPDGDPAFAPRPGVPEPDLLQELALTAPQFNQKFNRSPLRRARRSGYLRNIAASLGSRPDPQAIPALQTALSDDEALVRQHAAWALAEIEISQAEMNRPARINGDAEDGCGST